MKKRVQYSFYGLGWHRELGWCFERYKMALVKQVLGSVVLLLVDPPTIKLDEDFAPMLSTRQCARTAGSSYSLCRRRIMQIPF